MEGGREGGREGNQLVFLKNRDIVQTSNDLNSNHVIDMTYIFI